MPAPLTYEQLITAISDRYDAMSAVFRKAAQYIVQNPNAVALQSVKVTGQQSGVPASTLVRFAQSFEYSGFHEMQKVFQSRLTTALPGLDYRLERLRRELDVAVKGPSHGVLSDLVFRDIAALHDMLQRIAESDLERAADLIQGADRVYCVGQLRSFPVAFYMTYALTYLKRSAQLLDNLGSMAREQAGLLTERSVLFAVSFPYYARETVDIVQLAKTRGARIVAITDTVLSPLSKNADVCFHIPESAANFAYSIAAPACLAQALAIAVAHRIEGLPENIAQLLPAPSGAALGMR
jgi:DNA-binding MurR/RpiR family transcriptional regulator